MAKKSAPKKSRTWVDSLREFRVKKDAVRETKFTKHDWHAEAPKTAERRNGAKPAPNIPALRAEVEKNRDKMRKE
ncbi:MAG TPA: hypothetical protein VMZ26_17475 [Pyrinomonadaceae bacterium]|nr:hypothetical protein [Pyrinomonadaceae bacterium]